MTYGAPPLLLPGDVIRIVAASGPVPQDRFAAGLSRLQSRYEVRFDPQQVFARHGFLAGDDPARVAALHAAIADPEAKAIWLARGGYGLLRILPQIPWRSLRSFPKTLVGFSDGTALLAAAVAQSQLTSVHGPVITQLGELPAEDVEHLWRVLEGPRRGVLLSGLTPLVTGSAQGPLLGGNLEVFSRLLATPYLPQLDGAILFIEDVDEAPYRVDRLLTQLELSGILGRIAGALVGDFVQSNKPSSEAESSQGVKNSLQAGGQSEGGGSQTSLQAVIAERLARFGVPVAVGGLFGHGKRHLALPYGAEVRLEAGEGVLSYA